MSAVQTSIFTVLASRYRKSSDGKITAYLQVQSHPNAPVGYVRWATTQPPLAGTRIEATGTVVDSAQGPVMQVAGDNNVRVLTGQQGQILHKTVKTLLDRFNVAYDMAKLETTLQHPAIHLGGMDKDRLINALYDSGVANADVVVNEREETFADALSRNFFHGLEPIRLPYDTDTKRDLPFAKGTWPKEIVEGCLPQFIESTQGQKAHKAIANGRPFHLTRHVTYDGIDNFYRALGIVADQPDIFPRWIRDKSRPSALTQCYIEDKQAHGTQVFTGEDMKQLDRLGLQGSAKIAARLGNMVQLPPAEDGSMRMMPLGSYQSSAALAHLSKLEGSASPLKIDIQDTHLDPFQKKALHAFVEGKPLTLISGPPGSGKSTLIASMIEHASRAGLPVVVVTPTGKASSRLNVSFETAFPEAKTRPVSTTIHAMFYNNATFRKTHRSMPLLHTSSLRDALDSQATESFPVPVERTMRFSSYKDKKNDVAKPETLLMAEMIPAEILRGAVVIVDESTQVTGDLMALLCEMRPKKLVLTGDLSQLKPVGAGKPFHDLIALAKQGAMPERINAVELQIDHRATKELSDFTRKLREGSIPTDYVEEFNGDAQATVQEWNGREAAVLECKKLGNAIDVVEHLAARTVTEQGALFSVVSGQGTTPHTAIRLTEKTTPALFASTIAAPSFMAMAYTNAEVGHLNERVGSVLRPLMTVGDGFATLPAAAPIAAAGIHLGDPMLQTENAKQRLVYTTPAGPRLSSSSMNGETVVLLGAHTWLPLPSVQSPPLLRSWWLATGLDTEALDIQMHRKDDPAAHCELMRKLQALHTPEAQRILASSLTELLAVDQSKLKPGQETVLDEQSIKRLVLPPVPPKKQEKDNPEFDTFMGIVRNVWRLDTASLHAKPGKSGLVEYSTYKAAYQKIIAGIETFMPGFASTVHKAQGSQASVAVTVVAPPARDDDAANHEASVYTATTRAEAASYVLVHGTTVDKLNTQWAIAREMEAARPSPIQMIASGEIPAIGTNMQLMTPVPPQHRDEPISAATLRTRATLASHGLPPTLSLNAAPAYVRETMALSSRNDKVATIGLPTLPGMLDVGFTSHDLPERKKNFAWDPEAMLPGRLDTTMENVDLGEVLGAMDFGFDQ